SEVLQLIASLALGLLVAVRRKWSLTGALLMVALAGMCGALLLTLTRASWAGFRLSSLTVVTVGASRRTLLVLAAVALPVVVAGLFVLQQKRQVGLFDLRDESTSWRLMVWRDGARVLASEPRHIIVGVGMDSLKRHWREWGMFDQGRQPWGHLHSTPLQIAFERGLPTLFVCAACLFIYGRTLLRALRRRTLEGWVERGLVLGALGARVRFVAGGLLHDNLRAPRRARRARDALRARDRRDRARSLQGAVGHARPRREEGERHSHARTRPRAPRAPERVGLGILLHAGVARPLLLGRRGRGEE